MPRLELDAAGIIRCDADPDLLSYASPWPVPNGRPGGFVEPAFGMAFHTEVGYEHSVVHEFEDPTSQASAFCSIGLDGHIEQYGPIGHGWMAWTQADGNPHWRGVEHEDQGDPTKPLTAAQVESSASLLELFSRVDGFPIQITDDPFKGRGLITHQDGGTSWGGHACPGPVRTKQRPQIVARALQIREDDDMPSIDEIRAAIKDEVDAAKAEILTKIGGVGEVLSGKPKADGSDADAYHYGLGDAGRDIGDLREHFNLPKHASK